MGNQDYTKYDIWEIEVVTTSSGAYAAGDVLGSAYNLLDYDALKPIAGVIRSAQLIDRDACAANVDIAFLSSSVTATTIEGNSALALADADACRVIDVARITEHVQLGGSCLSRSGEVNIPFRLRSVGEQLQVIPIVRGAREHTSVAGLLLRLGIEQSE
jgi:hypothetical protein